MSITYTELKSQYTTLKQTANYLDENIAGLSAWIRESSPMKLIFVGCGTSYLVSVSLSDAANMYLPYPAFAMAGGDLLLHADKYAGMLNGSVIVTVSRSGTTTEVVEALKKLRSLGCGFKHLSVSCKTDSPLDFMSDKSVQMTWAYDHSVYQTRNVSNLYFFGMYLIALLAGKDDMKEAFEDVISNGDEFFKKAESVCLDVLKNDFDSVMVLGDGEIFGLCDAGAMAVKEICRIRANCYHVLDTRHGPIVLADDKTLVIAGLLGKKLEVDFVEDLTSRGAKVLTVTAEPFDAAGSVNLNYGKKLHHAALGLLCILACQLISYHKSALLGLNVDKPDDLESCIIL